MQEQRGAMGSFSETLGFEHGSASSDVVNSPSNRLPDYMSLNPASQEEENLTMWTVGEPSSSSGPSQSNQSHNEPRPDRGWPALMKSCPEPSSSALSLGDRGSSSSSFSDPFGPSSDPFELEARQVSRKRKAVELSIGQSSSGVGSSNMFQRSEGGPSSWRTVSEDPPSDPTIPRLGLSIGEHPVRENAHRNVDPLSANNNNRESDVSVLRLNLPVENSNSNSNSNSSSLQSQLGLRVPALRRNFQSTSRWSRSSSARANRSPNLATPGDRNEPDSISDHPLFTPPSNATTASQTELNVNTGGNGNGNGVVTGSRSGPSSGPSSSHHPRRLSAFLRRSLLSATDLEGGGVGQNGNIFARIPPPLSGSSSSSSSSSQDAGIPPGHHHQPLSRSSLLLGRQLEGVFAFPHHARTGTPGSEGRGRLVSEIRNVLDLMRRGEPLRFEDLMILDQSVFYGVADIHDRHRDMRLDIDNMSYEELLALEERIGNVNTGLTEETILKHIKQKQYVVETGQPNAEPCCICQEEYKDGDDLGTLDCGHDFHHGCLKQWLQQKNLCPICKSTGFATK
ncbi:putative transcription factor C2H2 family [Helianthus annuus]|nr:putative transcription factor C2H2 family [Helianthus annuus]